MSIVRGPFATVRRRPSDAFQAGDAREKLARHQRGFGLDHQVEEHRLIDQIDGRGFVHRRYAAHGDARLFESVDGRAQVSGAIAQIRT